MAAVVEESACGAPGRTARAARPIVGAGNRGRGDGAGMRAARVIVGVGNCERGDDAAGIEAARALASRARAVGIAVREHEGEALSLIDVWRDAGSLVLIDAVRGGGRPGSIVRADASAAPLPASLHPAGSTHAFGVDGALELARALGRLPERVVLLGVVGARFDAGAALSDAVRSAIEPLAAAALTELGAPEPACGR